MNAALSPYDAGERDDAAPEVDAGLGADAIGVKLTPPEGWHVEGFEVKRDVGDLDDELCRPEKSAPFRLTCRRWWLVVPFLKSVLRASRRDARGDGPGMVAGLPLVEVGRVLSRTEVQLACKHVVPRPLAKVRKGQRMPPQPCPFCAEEQKPATPAAVLARIAVAPLNKLRTYERPLCERIAAEEARGAA